jgi:hypothetical protein
MDLVKLTALLMKRRNFRRLDCFSRRISSVDALRGSLGETGSRRRRQEQEQ